MSKRVAVIQHRVAEYIGSLLPELIMMARAEGNEMLVYLLEMARIEANSQVELAAIARSSHPAVATDLRPSGALPQGAFHSAPVSAARE